MKKSSVMHIMNSAFAGVTAVLMIAGLAFPFVGVSSTVIPKLGETVCGFDLFSRFGSEWKMLLPSESALAVLFLIQLIIGIVLLLFVAVTVVSRQHRLSKGVFWSATTLSFLFAILYFVFGMVSLLSTKKELGLLYPQGTIPTLKMFTVAYLPLALQACLLFIYTIFRSLLKKYPIGTEEKREDTVKSEPASNAEIAADIYGNSICAQEAGAVSVKAEASCKQNAAPPRRIQSLSGEQQVKEFRMWKECFDEGILTEEEFNRKKKEVLFPEN